MKKPANKNNKLTTQPKKATQAKKVAKVAKKVAQVKPKKASQVKTQPVKVKKFIPKLKFSISDEQLDEGQTIVIIPDDNGKTIPELLDKNGFAYCNVKFPETHISISRNVVNKKLKKPSWFVYHPCSTIGNNESVKNWEWSVKNGGFKNNNLNQASEIVEKFIKKITLKAKKQAKIKPKTKKAAKAKSR